MRRRTYLTPEEQWARSLDLLHQTRWDRLYVLPHLRRGDPEPEALGERILLGRIAGPHKCFLSGDIVFAWINNGTDERFPVWAVSSKGYAVRGLYLKYQNYWYSKEQEERRRLAGPLRIVELPDDLVGKAPDDPAVRHFVAALRAGDAASG